MTKRIPLKKEKETKYVFIQPLRYVSGATQSQFCKWNTTGLRTESFFPVRPVAELMLKSPGYPTIYP